ncbi:MAG: UDP-N-acetylmuramate dehydrogenase [Treponema sp.]|nr:UDP-N-acetylmuramate dehydrogenase [Treponema sp.]
MDCTANEHIIEEILSFSRKLGRSPLFKGDILFSEPMAPRTTMRVGGNAVALAVPYDAESAVYAACAACMADVPIFVLGGGSNIIVSDRGLAALVISLEKLSGIEYKDGFLCVGSGAKFDLITEFCAKNCLKGLSAFAGLPGTAGGAAYMNARCYGVSFSDLMESVSYVNLDEIFDEKQSLSDFSLANLLKVYHNNGGGWDYKQSPFQSFSSLVLSVQFRVEPLDRNEGNEGLIRSQNEGFIEDRRGKGHFAAPSAGSVFKNDRRFGKPSGQLVDEAGLKGLVVGGAQIAPWHGNFIINNGSATAGDIKSLVEKAQAAVKERTGFTLEPEVIFV